MKKYFLSKNYTDLSSAGNKAKTDIEWILSEHGFRSAGFNQTRCKSTIIGFLLTLLSVIKASFTLGRGDVLIMQYPLKKYYTFVCRMARLRGCKTITIIHDLGSFRRKKLEIDQEIKKLSSSDYIIAHNEAMKDWLISQGLKKPIGILGVFDYLSDIQPSSNAIPKKQFRVVYAGGMSYKKNRFLYETNQIINNWHFNLYGKGFEEKEVKDSEHYSYKGFVLPDKLIQTIEGDFGLIWDGDSVDTCSGSFGEYLRYNNPHKISLYIRCQLPVIIWKEAALAHFVETHDIGICVASLRELDNLLPTIDKEKYERMKTNVRALSKKVSKGDFVWSAYVKAEKKLHHHVKD